MLRKLLQIQIPIPAAWPRIWRSLRWWLVIAFVTIWAGIAAEQFVYLYFGTAAILISLVWLSSWLLFRLLTRRWCRTIPPRLRLSFHLAFISAFLCMASIYCWFHSYDTYTHSWNQYAAFSQTHIDFAAGAYFARKIKMPAGEAPSTIDPWRLTSNSGVIFNQMSAARSVPWHGNLPDHPGIGFGCGSGIAKNYLPAGGTRISAVMFPCWLPVALTALIPACWTLSFARQLRTQKRRDANICITCGYDLRATPDRCPECGTQVLTTPAHSAT